MDNYFDSEIKRLNDEITWLKTSGQRSALVIPTVSKTVTKQIKFEYLDSGYTFGGAYFTVTSEHYAVVMATLDQYYSDITLNDHHSNNSRSAKIILYKPYPNTTSMTINCIGNQTDYNKVLNGETVTMTVKLTIRCTSNFTIEEF